jgi:3-methyl-2-oxobutanoate hydroxymethyltransferase
MKKITLKTLIDMKRTGEKITLLTCYDATFSRLLNEAKIDILLIGDTLGEMVQGHPTTVFVQIEDMAYHVRAVARQNSYSFLIGDMPFLTYTTCDEALKNAKILMQAGAHMVKMEGGQQLVPIIEHLTRFGIPVCAHIGLTPQFYHQLSGYRVQGREPNKAKQLLEDAKALVAAGCQILVMECIPQKLAKEITESCAVPTLGIGAGPDCDGQILVLYDILGMNTRKLTFSKNYLAASPDHSILGAFVTYREEVKSQIFPTIEHGFD